MTKEVFAYIEETYGVRPEFLWPRTPDAAAIRHPSGKWFAAWMRIPRRKLGLDSDELVDVLDLKREPMMGMVDHERIFPGYHMNKEHWISVLLDGSVPMEELKSLIAMSYDLIK